VGAHGYAVTNLLTGRAAGDFVWSNGATTNRTYVCDGRMDKLQVVGASVASGINVIIDLGAAAIVRAVAILNSNAAVQKTDAAVAIDISSSATFASDVTAIKLASTLNSTAPFNKDHVLQTANTAVSKRYVRLTWTWTGSVTNFSIGEFFIFVKPAATYPQLARRSIYGSGETHEAIVAQQRMQYGETRGLFLAGPVRQLDLQWDDLSATERDELYAMHAASSFGARPLLWVQSYEASALAAAAAEQECIFGRIVDPQFQWSHKDFAIYQPGGFSIRSLGREAGA
jgi:hypothetical protein